MSLITRGNHCIVCLHCWILCICCQQGRHRFPLGNSSLLGDSAFSRSPQSSRFHHFLISPQYSRFCHFLIFHFLPKGFVILSLSHFTFSPQSSRFYHFSFSFSPQTSRFYQQIEEKRSENVNISGSWVRCNSDGMLVECLLHRCPLLGTLLLLVFITSRLRIIDMTTFVTTFFYLQIFLGELVKTIGTHRHAEVLTNIR